MQKTREMFGPWAMLVWLVVICGLLFVFRQEILNFVSPKEDVQVQSQDNRTVTMQTVLSKDAIPSIDDPQFVSPETADSQYDDDELVIGVNINGDARAYSVPLLSRHEIVNDVVGGKPVAVTW